MSSFREENSFGIIALLLIYIDKRVELYNKIKSSFPSQIPVIVERAPGAEGPNIKKKKFLSPPDITLEAFFEEVKGQFESDHNESTVIDFLFNTPKGVIAPHFCIIAFHYFFSYTCLLCI